MSASFLMVLWAGGGNVNPFLALAEQLMARGHQVGSVATASLQPRLEAAGITTVVAADQWLPDARDLREAIDRFGPDVLVVDYMLTPALCEADRSGRPTVALVHTLYTALLSDGAPHPIAMAGGVDAVNQLRAEMGLAPIVTHADLLRVVDLVLVAAPRELDVDAPVAANVVYAGALFEGPGPDAGWEPPGGDSPLVVVSLGTAGEADRECAVLERILDALGRLPVRGLVTVADYIDPGRLRPPANVALSGYVRHAAVLPHASVMVTHAGLGSVLAALAHGVPLVCLPLAREQPENAAAVVRIGAGCAIDPGAGAAEIAQAIDQQLRRLRPIRIDADPAPALRRLEALPLSRRPDDG